MAPSIRAIIRAIDPSLPVSEVGTLTDVVDRDTASRSVQLRVLGAFAVIAFVLAGIGIHGLLSFAVSQRAQEIGVRIALGAKPSDILSMVVGRCVRLAVAGVVPASRSPMRRGGAWKRCSPASSRRTRPRWRAPSTWWS